MTKMAVMRGRALRRRILFLVVLGELLVLVAALTLQYTSATASGPMGQGRGRGTAQVATWGVTMGLSTASSGLEPSAAAPVEAGRSEVTSERRQHVARILSESLGVVASTVVRQRCDSDVGCAADERCEVTGCVVGARECRGDSGCGEDRRCVSGRCGAGARECRNDDACGEDRRCVWGRCGEGARECWVDGDCSEGSRCESGTCGEGSREYGRCEIEAERLDSGPEEAS